jgi:hypothetical protein
LEKEPETTAEKVEDSPSSTSAPTAVKKQYDIMISYSHKDKKLCDEIQKRLRSDQLNVWIDSSRLNGEIFGTIADAIENAEFVLICMSDTYKQSPYCKMEANYAVSCKCHIIPLRMTPNYRPDGWLGMMSSGFIYIDFPKLGFDRAYQELKKQIELLRTKNPFPSVVKQDQIHHDLSSSMDVISKPIPNVINKKEPRPVV